ncbi:MAG: hypothetical protein NT069_15810 [Planctomycetota bacterium]|nr:hypothetical protein [Planctomycetota bacterium]
MTRIFLTLASLCIAALALSFWLGWSIGDARTNDPAVQSRVAMHMLFAVGSLVFAVLVHALVLTYFMGTGRWLEETCNAYRLGSDPQERSRRIKIRIYPALTLCLVLLITTGGYGAASDPASAFGFKGYGPFTAGQVHLGIAFGTIVINAVVFVFEFQSLLKNGRIVDDILARVRQIRVERGLPVE